MIDFTFDSTVKKLTAIADCILSFVIVGGGGGPGGNDRYSGSSGISGDTIKGKVSLKKGDILYCAVGSRGLPGAQGWGTQAGGVGGTSINGFSGGRGGNSGPSGASGAGGGGGGATILWRNNTTPTLGEVTYTSKYIVHKSSYDPGNFAPFYLVRPLSTSNGFFVRSAAPLTANSSIHDQREYWVVINGSIVYHSTTTSPKNYFPYEFVSSQYALWETWPGGGDYITIFSVQEEIKTPNYGSNNIVAIAAGGGGGGGGGNYGAGYISANPILEKTYVGSTMTDPFQNIIAPKTSGYYIYGGAYYNGAVEGSTELFNGILHCVVVNGKIIYGPSNVAPPPKVATATEYVGESSRVSTGNITADVVQCFSFRSTFDNDLVPKRAYAYSQNPPTVTSYTASLIDPFITNNIPAGASAYCVRGYTDSVNGPSGGATYEIAWTVIINGVIVYTSTQDNRFAGITRGALVGNSYIAGGRNGVGSDFDFVKCYSFTASTDGVYDTRGAAGQYHRGDGGGAGAGGGGFRGGSGGTAPGGDTGGQAGSNGMSYISPEVIPAYDINVGDPTSYGGDNTVYDASWNGYAAFDALQTNSYVKMKKQNVTTYIAEHTPTYYSKAPYLQDWETPIYYYGVDDTEQTPVTPPVPPTPPYTPIVPPVVPVTPVTPKLTGGTAAVVVVVTPVVISTPVVTTPVVVVDVVTGTNIDTVTIGTDTVSTTPADPITNDDSDDVSDDSVVSDDADDADTSAVADADTAPDSVDGDADADADGDSGDGDGVGGTSGDSAD
jgi:hypothetical protein